MLERFVITEFFRQPYEDYGHTKIWYHKDTWKEKRVIFYEKDGTLDNFFDKDGKLHRDNDHPATIHSSGIEGYYFHGKIHRGHFKPAIIYPNGIKEYWVYGEKRFETLSLTKNELF